MLRCEVASLQQGLVYRGACVFDRMIQIPGTPSQGSVTLREDTASRDEAVKLIRTLAARNADPARLGRIIAEIRTAVERGESPDSVLHFVERELAGPVAAPAPIGTAGGRHRQRAGAGGRAQLSTCATAVRRPCRRGAAVRAVGAGSGAGRTVATAQPAARTRPPAPAGTSWSCAISTEPC